MNRTHEIAEVLADVKYRDWRFDVAREWTTGAAVRSPTQADIHSIAVIFSAVDTDTGKPALQRGREWLISPWMNRDQIVHTALLAVLTAIEHEAREEFLYQGEAVFGPHHNVEHLHKLVQGREVVGG